MDDIDVTIAGMERDLEELSKVIEALGRRLAAGENTIRAQLNPAIRRQRELMAELHALKVASGRYKVEPAPMYGPPRVPLNAEPSKPPEPPGIRPSAPPANSSSAGPPIDDVPRTNEARRSGWLRRLLGLK